MKCDRKGCTSEEAIWSPVLVLYAPLHRYTGDPVPLRSQLGMRICEAHKQTAKASCFISDDGWAQIEDAFTRLGGAVPQRNLTQLEWVLWEDSMLRKAQLAASAQNN